MPVSAEMLAWAVQIRCTSREQSGVISGSEKRWYSRVEIPLKQHFRCEGFSYCVRKVLWGKLQGSVWSPVDRRWSVVSCPGQRWQPLPWVW